MGITEQVAAASGLPPDARGTLSLTAYLGLASQGPLMEWVNGRVVVHALPTAAHQRLALFLTWLLAAFADRFQLGEVFQAGYPMVLSGTGPARQPDVLFVAARHAGQIQSQALHGPADLAIELVSQDSVTRDRREKFAEYAASGVGEYWVIDVRQGRHQAEFWILDGAGVYRARPADPEGVYRSVAVPGFSVRLDWLWPNGQPGVSRAFDEVLRLAAEADLPSASATQPPAPGPE